MPKKNKVPTLKEIEDNLHEWKSDPVRFELTKQRNDRMRAELKECKINMRVSGNDLSRLMEKAAEKGMGYQTLLSSLIHLYVRDRLVDITEIQKIMVPQKVSVGSKTTKKRS